MVTTRPPHRRLRVYTLDPSLASRLDTALINQTILNVPWEHDPVTGLDRLGPGPAGEYLEVIDFDPASQCFYEPVDLSDPYLLAQDGLAPSEANPMFHQQMVYAVAMTTIVNFERALGRKILWAPRLSHDSKTGEIKAVPVFALRVYPHALREANAYYSPEKKALLFGYFPSETSDAEVGFPGGLVFTCLSQDVIAHETTHALLDGIHRYFAEASNPDVPALHEGFADIVALFQHFSQPDALRHQIARTRGDLRTRNLLGELAQQFGQAIGNHGALRDYLGGFDADKKQWQPREPKATDYTSAQEDHDRGAVLVAALFDAFLSIYEARVADLIRIATGGTGILPIGQIHPDLVNRLADEASRTASHFQRMAIRALDYCPPVDITFGEYLRALVTGDADLWPEDRWGYRIAVIDAFRRRGIYAPGVRVLGDDVLRWQAPTAEMPNFADLIRMFKQERRVLGERRRGQNLPELPTLEWQTGADRREIEMQTSRYRTLTWLWMYDRLGAPGDARKSPGSFAAELGLDLEASAKPTIFRSKKVYKGKTERLPSLEIHSVRISRRSHEDGRTRTDLVIEMTQRRRGYADPGKQAQADALPVDSPRFDQDFRPDFVMRGGATLLIDSETGAVRYCIRKDISSESRLARQREFATDHFEPSLRAAYDLEGAAAERREPFALLHRRY
jgi:hypothetical protein